MRRLRQFVILIAFLANTTPLYAVPAAPHFHDLQQPDGTIITARQWGDEHSHGWEAETGHSIVFDKQFKGWAYAVHDRQGKLSSSTILVKQSTPPPADIPKKLRPRKASALNAVSQPVSAPPLFATQAPAPVIGTKSLPVIMIQFPDANAQFVKTKADFDNLLFGTTGNTMRNYYLENSYNQLIVDKGSSGVYGPVTSHNNRAFYGGNDLNGDDLQAGTLVYEAVSKAAAGGFKFAPFVDQTKSCYVDVVAIVHQGTGEETGFNANDIWSNSWNLNDALYYGNSSNGEFVTNETCSRGGYIKVNKYTIQPELSVPNGTMVGVGVFAHEFGHALGLPDLYDTDETSEGAGYWTVMASGMWLGKIIWYLNKTGL